ncbi:hypothetical protein BUPH_08371 (plasmid) [Paraburkholderia phenoliruptrix BR3459a]|uniref:Uncharacterized protein n=1 Tax=Paraburkholderia phenoliruptrix BR3459a TaxID=1229205 RepID=K0E0I7_9BURK|nr:hypothetical protein BUPH_08371 [Paraburkholderia phenoliruptrix BR3459a]
MYPQARRSGDALQIGDPWAGAPFGHLLQADEFTLSREAWCGIFQRVERRPQVFRAVCVIGHDSVQKLKRRSGKFLAYGGIVEFLNDRKCDSNAGATDRW